MSESITVIIPARDEAGAIGDVVAGVRRHNPEAEILVVDDGSTDNTAAIARDAGATVLTHPVSLGNGAAIKTGAREAGADWLVFMDGDGQHRPEDIQRLLEKRDQGYEMIVGARGSDSQAGFHRGVANALYNRIASWMTNQQIEDLTSGFRVVRRSLFRRFLYLLPNGFSYPTTITMAFFRSAYPVTYVPITAAERVGKSHIRPLHDGVRFLLIIFKIGTLYSPLKLFVPISGLFFLAGLSYYGYTYTTMNRFTNMSLLLFSAAVIVFLIGLISEQITQLHYRDFSD